MRNPGVTYSSRKILHILSIIALRLWSWAQKNTVFALLYFLVCRSLCWGWKRGFCTTRYTCYLYCLSRAKFIYLTPVDEVMLHFSKRKRQHMDLLYHSKCCVAGGIFSSHPTRSKRGEQHSSVTAVWDCVQISFWREKNVLNALYWTEALLVNDDSYLQVLSSMISGWRLFCNYIGNVKGITPLVWASAPCRTWNRYISDQKELPVLFEVHVRQVLSSKSEISAAVKIKNAGSVFIAEMDGIQTRTDILPSLQILLPLEQVSFFITISDRTSKPFAV